jgi:hypothetical protein
MGENPCQLFNWQGLKSRIYNDLQKKKTPKESILIIALLICS